jgi:hypothetical protein
MVKGVAAAAATLALGCATGVGKPIVEFPSPERLASVESKPAVLPAIQAGEVPAEGWTIPSTPADAEAAWAPRGPWEERLARAYAAMGSPKALTRGMACVAGELGRFYLAKQAPAPEPLQRWLTAACGVFAPAVAYQTLQATMPAGAPDEKLLAQWGDQIGMGLAGLIPAGARQVGFWFDRRDGHAVALVAYDSTPVTLQPFSPVPDVNGDVVMEGRLEEGAADYFEGYVNQGRFGVKECLVDPSVERPSFRVSCRMAPGDQTAWIQIFFAAPRSVLAQPIVQVLARRDAEKPLVYREAAYAPSRSVSDAASFAPAVLAALNATRVQAGLAAVRLAKAQSETAGRVARQYFAAALGPSGMADGGLVVAGALDDMNTIALGLLAGWQVAGTIRDGTFVSVIVPRTRDAGRWVDYALSMPIGRVALMAPEIEEVALGPAFFSDPDGIGGIACGYRFHRSNDHTADVNHVLGRITAARQRMNLPPPVRLSGMDAVLHRELARVQEGKGTPMNALHSSLEVASERYNAPTQGIVIEATSLDALEIPPEVFSQANLQLEVGVTHYKPPGAAWAQLVIIVVYVSPTGLSI